MNESTRLGSIKQEIIHLKNEVNTLMSNFKGEIQQKFATVNKRINTMESSVKTIISDQVSERIMRVKDSVIEALKENNLKMQKRLKLWNSNS